MSSRPSNDSTVAAMFAADAAARTLGIELVSAAAGNATLRMRVTDEMVNGYGSAHGGYLFVFADTAFACACNSYGPKPSRQGPTSRSLLRRSRVTSWSPRPPSAPASDATASTTSPCFVTTAAGAR
jgi:acyl-coenzyme A thioesterase PaaI-like protein